MEIFQESGFVYPLKTTLGNPDKLDGHTLIIDRSGDRRVYFAQEADGKTNVYNMDGVNLSADNVGWSIRAETLKPVREEDKPVIEELVRGLGLAPV